MIDVLWVQSKLTDEGREARAAQDLLLHAGKALEDVRSIHRSHKIRRHTRLFHKDQGLRLIFVSAGAVRLHKRAVLPREPRR